MTFIDYIDNFTDYQPEPSEADKLAAIEHLAEQSIESFAKSNITQSDAEDLAITNEEFVQQCANLAPANLDSINPAKYAYYLAYSNPELGSQLLNELLYYREQNRI